MLLPRREADNTVPKINVNMWELVGEWNNGKKYRFQKENSENYDNMEVSKCVSKYSISIKKGGTLKTITENDK